ncbi:MAG: hypothetical protein ACP5MB_08125 [bacterium]
MIDLTKLQNRYRVSFEESYNYAGELDRADPGFPIMYQIIAGKFGEIYSYDDKHLAVYVIGQYRYKKISRLDGIKTLHDCDGEGVYLFKADNLELLDTLAKIIHARKKRQVSDKEKERLKSLSKQYGFKKQTTDAQILLNFTSINAHPEAKKL